MESRDMTRLGTKHRTFMCLRSADALIGCTRLRGGPNPQWLTDSLLLFAWTRWQCPVKNLGSSRQAEVRSEHLKHKNRKIWVTKCARDGIWGNASSNMPGEESVVEDCGSAWRTAHRKSRPPSLILWTTAIIDWSIGKKTLIFFRYQGSAISPLEPYIKWGCPRASEILHLGVRENLIWCYAYNHVTMSRYQGLSNPRTLLPKVIAQVVSTQESFLRTGYYLGR